VDDRLYVSSRRLRRGIEVRDPSDGRHIPPDRGEDGGEYDAVFVVNDIVRAERA
jgi:hypothetical protein